MLKRALFLAQVGTIGMGLFLVVTQPSSSSAAPVVSQRLKGEVTTSSVLRPAPKPVLKAKPRPRAVVPARRKAPVRVRVAPKPNAPRSTAPKVTAFRVLTPAQAVTAPSSTPQQRMMSAVARIPGYHTGDAAWILSDKYGAWGAADWYNGRVYISPSVPAKRIYDVVVHEWSHLLSVKDYGGDVEAATTAMNAWFGGGGLAGAERAGDCMARVLGAVWTNYTSCTDSHWQDGARILVAGGKLPTS